MLSSVYIKPLLALLVIAAIVGIVTVIFRSGPHGSAPVQSANQQLPHNIDVALKKARFTEIQNGLVVWELAAERVEYDKTGDTAFLSDIRMVFPGTPPHGAVTVTADKGEYSILAKTVRLNGHVLVATEDGASFKTSSIEYKGATAQFSTADTVLFRQQRLQLTAVGMNFGINNQQARFYSAVNALITGR